LMVTLPVSPCMVIHGPSGLQFSEVWGFLGMGHKPPCSQIRCPHARAHPYRLLTGALGDRA
jgi:hypothetical protein